MEPVAWAVFDGPDRMHLAPGYSEAESCAEDIGGEIVPLYRSPRWISVEERMPPINEPVLYTCFFDDIEEYWIDVDVGCWDGQELNLPGKPIMRDRHGERGPTHWNPCSHWQPLPEPPGPANGTR